MFKDKIVWKFLWAYVPIILIAVIVLNFFVSISMRDSFEQAITDKLKSNAILVSDIVGDMMISGEIVNLQTQVNAIAQKQKYRITIVDMHGKVLSDSDGLAYNMNDHGDRPEIIEAITSGIGESKRLSETLKVTMKYVSVPVKNKDVNVGIVRLAVPLGSMDKQVRTIYRAVLYGGGVAIVLTLIVGYFVSRSITKPIEDIRKIAQSLSEGDLSKRISITGENELSSLAGSLNKMADELERQINSLKRADKVRSDFVANVSHELKTPLTSIKGFVETLEDGAIDDKENAARFLSIIKKHADSLSNIVNDLLCLSEAEGDQDNLHKETFDARSLINEILLGFGSSVKSKNQNIECSFNGNDFHIFADRTSIEQILVNVIDNAVKYTNDNGEIAINVNQEGDKLIIRVKDNGIGIPRNKVKRVFERFYRVDKARSKEVGGTGLGLSIVKHLVFMHQGTIDIESEEKKGTVITVMLPKA